MGFSEVGKEDGELESIVSAGELHVLYQLAVPGSYLKATSPKGRLVRESRNVCNKNVEINWGVF